VVEATLAPAEMACTKCRTVKPLGEFYRDRNRKKGYHPWCRECHSPGRQRRPDRTPAQRVRNRTVGRYGLTIEQYEEMWAQQGERCAGCGAAETKGRNWHIDHDHVTGRVRGILCHGCNLALGHMDDDAERLARLTAYAARQAAIAAG
jgi:hypothetical protein